MSEAEGKIRKPRKVKKTAVELRLEQGVRLLKTNGGDADRGAYWTYADTGRVARSDVCERLVQKGILRPLDDGLFPGDSQTWGGA